MSKAKWLLACGLACLLCTAARAAIYVCTDRDGHRTYSDHGCPNKQVYTPPAVPPITFEPIAPSDVKRLQQSARDQARNRQALNQVRRKRRQALQERASQREQTCRQAKADLAALAHKRRKGYSLSSQSRLDETQALLKRRKRDNC